MQCPQFWVNKSRAGNITIFDFKLYYRAIVTKPAQYWHKNRYEIQRDSTDDVQVNTLWYSNLIFDKAAKNTQWEKTASLTNGTEKTGYLHPPKKMRLHLYLSHCTKINSKWVKDLNAGLSTLKLL
jgi:hypothetical protein